MPVDNLMIDSLRRQHAATAQKLITRIASCNQAVRLDLAHNRPAGAAARQLQAEVQSLLDTLAELRTVERLAGWARKPAA